MASRNTSSSFSPYFFVQFQMCKGLAKFAIITTTFGHIYYSIQCVSSNTWYTRDTLVISETNCHQAAKLRSSSIYQMKLGLLNLIIWHWHTPCSLSNDRAKSTWKSELTKQFLTSIILEVGYRDPVPTDVNRKVSIISKNRISLSFHYKFRKYMICLNLCCKNLNDGRVLLIYQLNRDSANMGLYRLLVLLLCL